MSNNWHPKSGTRRKGIHPILLDGGGRFDREHAYRCVEWRRRHPEYTPSTAQDINWTEYDNAVTDSIGPWWAVMAVALACAVIVFLGYIAF